MADTENFLSIEGMDEEQKNELLNNNGLSASNLLVPSVYKELFLGNYNKFILSSGRIAGKTSILVAKWWETINKYPNRDIIILQATATEIKDSIINEIAKFLSKSGFDVGPSPTCEWQIPASKDKVIHRGDIGGTYFYPITDSYGGQRTRGITTKNGLSLIMFEEAQKNKDANVLEQAVATFIRQMDDDAKMIIVGNNETVGHWFVDFVNDKRLDKDWKYIYANCYDIWQLLNQQTRDYIETFKQVNYIDFRRMFLGDIHANSSNVVFPQFSREKNYKRAYELEKHYITTVIVGVDHATANDTFAIVPVAVLDDGTTQTLEIAFDDPQDSGRSLAPSEQAEILDEFLKFLDDKYGLEYNQVQTVLSVDGAASHFIQQLMHLKHTSKNRKLWSKVLIKGFTAKKKYGTNLPIIKNAFAYGVLTILNEGASMWNGDRNEHRLVKEIERQRYKNGKLDKSIPNDLCDALEYALIPYYTNCYNLSFPIRKVDYKRSAHYDEIRKLAKLA